MTLELDLESALRAYLHTDPNSKLEMSLSINAEGRVVARIGQGEGCPEFVVFGNNVRQWPTPKPSAQRAAVQGFDAHRGMGER